jgi:hypothetical protein
MMARSELECRVLSEPHGVHFAGFKSTTSALQEAGWRIAAEQDFMHDRIRLLLNHPGANLNLLCDAKDYRFTQMTREMRRLEFVVSSCASRMDVVVNDRSFNFQQIDAIPTYTMAPRRRIEDFGIFATQLARTEEIIIEPQSVAECLDLIRRLQAPELAAIRKRNSANDAMPRQIFHAQVLSLAA